MTSKWIWSERESCYLIGNSDDGCGVQWEGNGWTGQAIVKNETENIRDYPTAEEAKEVVMEVWLALREKLGIMGQTPVTEM
jgi:hypothetical protein